MEGMDCEGTYLYTGSVHSIAYSADKDAEFDDVAGCDGERKS